MTSLKTWIPYYALLRVGALCVKGEQAVCRPLQAMRGYGLRQRMLELKQSMREQCRQLETDEAQGVLWDTPAGRWWAPPGAHIGYIATLVAEQILDVYRLGEWLRPGDVVVDCGGNIGVSTLAAMKHAAGRAVIIEPSQLNLIYLRRNLQKEIASGKVTVVEAGVWKEEGEFRLEVVTAENPGANRLGSPSSRNGDSIPVHRLDSILQRIGVSRVDFLKMDVEGAEREAMTGAVETLRRDRPRIAVAVEHTEDPAANARAVCETVLQLQPEYQWTSSYCRVNRSRIVYPEMLYFEVPRR